MVADALSRKASCMENLAALQVEERCNTPYVLGPRKLKVQYFAEGMILRATLRSIEVTTGHRCIREKYLVKMEN